MNRAGCEPARPTPNGAASGTGVMTSRAARKSRLRRFQTSLLGFSLLRLLLRSALRGSLGGRFVFADKTYSSVQKIRGLFGIADKWRHAPHRAILLPSEEPRESDNGQQIGGDETRHEGKGCHRQTISLSPFDRGSVASRRPNWARYAC
jgi:hypothetical protein